MVALALGGLAVTAGRGNAAEPPWTVVISNLDNPRGLEFNAAGRLIVAEAGHGGDITLQEGPGGPTPLGLTSQISSVNVTNGSKRVLLSGLMSVGRVESTGVDGISLRAGRLLGIMSGSPQVLNGLPKDFCSTQPKDCRSVMRTFRQQLGQLIQAKPGNTFDKVAPVGRYNYNWIVAHKAKVDPKNPDFRPGDSNPYGVDDAGKLVYVVDGGSNTLDSVDANGKIKVLAYLPNPPGPAARRFPYDAVPTCVVAMGPNVYVGDLAGRLWKWDGQALSEVTIPADLHLTACAGDRQGNLYLVSIFGAFGPHGPEPNSGSVVKIDKNGEAETLATGMNAPGGIAIAKDGSVYVSHNSTCPADISGVESECPASGEIVKLHA